MRGNLRIWMAVVVVLAMGAAGCSGDETSKDGASATTAAGASNASAPSTAPLPTHISVSDDDGRPRFVDGQGREVLLRGVNVIALGDYYQADPELDPTIPITDDDWAGMASLGFGVIRLILSWSALEPTKGELDAGYVERIHQFVDDAAAHGLSTVLDMHQDAWGTSVASPPGTTCPPGKETAIGWDGAPEWATITDGADTCRDPGVRETAPAVKTTFEAFYDDREGIRTALVDTWGELAEEFADDEAVAGYDILNEPNSIGTLAELQPKYTAFVQEAIASIRSGEEAGGGYSHVVFVEPIVVFPLPDAAPAAGFTDDPNVAFSPHNYWGSIVSEVPVETGFQFDSAAATALDMPYWIGEYGWWDTSAESLQELRQYAVAEDAALVGGAWWQWRQACGDPHSIGVAGNVPDDQIHLNGQRCPEEEDLGLTEEFALVLSRAYPRAAPGELLSLTSDPDDGTMTLSGLTGEADPDAPLVVWVPGDDEPEVGGTGIADVEVERVDGGFVVTATAGCDYSLSVGLGSTITPSSC